MTGTQAEYARHAGVSKQAVSRAVSEGRITQLPDGGIDFEQADREWAKNTDPENPRNRFTGNPKANGSGRKVSATRGIAQARARRARAQASLEELKLAQLRDELLPKADVVRETFEAHRRARDRLRMIDARMGGMLSPELREMLRKEIRDVCDELGGEGA